MADYVSTNEGDLVIQLKDHAIGVSTHSATVGLAAGDVTEASNDAAIASHAVNGQSLYTSKSQEWTEYKRLLLYGPLNTPTPITPVAPVVGSLPLGAKGRDCSEVPATGRPDQIASGLHSCHR